MKKIKYSWTQFDRDCKEIAKWAKSHKFANVYGIPRGGLILAVRLSHLLNIPLARMPDEVNKDTLVVDDICDTGATMIKLKDHTLLYNMKTATLHYCKTRVYEPTYNCRLKKDWIIYPWESEDSSKYDGTY